MKKKVVTELPPKVSVIVPVYNVEPYLPRCADSILAQTLADIEIIFIDDGSTDNSGLICDQYKEKDRRVKVIHKENGGQSSARNCGISIANGEYIAFVDADDRIAEDMYENLCRKMESDASDMVVCNYIGVRSDGQDNSPLKINDNTVFSISDLGRAEYIFDYLLAGKHDYSACNKLFRADVILKNRIRFPEVRIAICEDAFFIMKYVLTANKISFADKPYYYYCYRAGSSSHAPRLERLNYYMANIEDFSKFLVSIDKVKEYRFLCPCLCLFFLNRGCSEINERLGERDLLTQRVAALNLNKFFKKSMRWLAFGNSGNCLRRYFGFSGKGAFAFRYKAFLCGTGKTEKIIDSIV